MVCIKRTLLHIIAAIYSILFIVMFGTTLYPYHSNFNIIFRLQMTLIFGGYPGLLFILLSIKQLYNLYTLRALIYGWIGCIAIGFNLIIYPGNPPSIELTVFYFLGLQMWAGFLIINFSLIVLYLFRGGFKVNPKIRRTILDLATKYARLEVREISEKCKIDRANIIDVIKQMIDNNEIYAEYFSSSKTVAFNRQANIAEIDNLMKIYQKWEEEQFKKK